VGAGALVLAAHQAERAEIAPGLRLGVAVAERDREIERLDVVRLGEIELPAPVVHEADRRPRALLGAAIVPAPRLAERELELGERLVEAALREPRLAELGPHRAPLGAAQPIARGLEIADARRHLAPIAQHPGARDERARAPPLVELGRREQLGEPREVRATGTDPRQHRIDREQELGLERDRLGIARVAIAQPVVRREQVVALRGEPGERSAPALAAQLGGAPGSGLGEEAREAQRGLGVVEPLPGVLAHALEHAEPRAVGARAREQ